MLTVVILLIAAFVFALCSVAAVIGVAGAASHWPGRMFSYLMWMIVIASLGTILLSERVLRIEQQGLVVGAESEIGGTILAKLLLVAVIGVSVALCAAWVFSSSKKRAKSNRFEQRELYSPKDIVIAFMVFYVAFNILPLVFGESHHFHVSLIYPFFIFLALFLWMQLSRVDPVVVVKQCLGLVVITSLGAAVLAPQLAVQPSYIGLIPGFNSRLWGLTAGPNALGSVACALLIIETAEPSARLWVRGCILAAAGLALVLTQSKTSIAAAMLGLSIIFSWRLLSSVGAKARSNSTKQSLIISGLIIGFCALVMVSGVWVMFSDTSLLASLERQLDGRAVGDLTTGAGRTLIWNMAIQGGMENPLFGQGWGFWTAENRLRWGLNGAVHAHNLFLQAFSRAGLVGLVALLIFLYFILSYSTRAAEYTRGGSIALAAMFLVRAVSEVPLQPNSVLGSEFFAMMAFFIYVIDRGAKRRYKTMSQPRSRHVF